MTNLALDEFGVWHLMEMLPHQVSSSSESVHCVSSIIFNYLFNGISFFLRFSFFRFFVFFLIKFQYLPSNFLYSFGLIFFFFPSYYYSAEPSNPTLFFLWNVSHNFCALFMWPLRLRLLVYYSLVLLGSDLNIRGIKQQLLWLIPHDRHVFRICPH